MSLLATAGFIPQLPTAIPYQDFFSLADSLLATPVYAVLVSGDKPNDVADTAVDLQKRGGDSWIVGGYCAAEAANEEALFQFPFVQPDKTSKKMERFSFPVVRSVAQVDRIAQAAPMVVVAQTADLDQFQRMTQIAPAVSWWVWSKIHHRAIPAWQEVGLKSLIAPIWFHNDQTMPETIRLARRYNSYFHAWDEEEVNQVSGGGKHLP